MATSSRARRRPEIPGRASASFSAARDSGKRPACPALGQCPVQVNKQIRVGGGGQRAVGNAFRLGGVTHPVQRLGEAADQAVVPGRADRGPRDGLAEEFRGSPGGLADQQRGGAIQPAQDPRVHRLRGVTCAGHRLQKLPGDPVSRRIRLGQCPRGLSVPGRPHRGWYLLIKRCTDHRMAEPQAAT